MSIHLAICLSHTVVRRPYNLYCVGADVKPCSINCHTVVLKTYPGNSFTTGHLVFLNLSADYKIVSGSPLTDNAGEV